MLYDLLQNLKRTLQFYLPISLIAFNIKSPSLLLTGQDR